VQNGPDGFRGRAAKDRGREIEISGADRTAAALGIQDGTPVSDRAVVGAGLRLGVHLTEDAAVARGSSAALALAALATGQTVVGLVDGNPVPMLARLPLAGRKARKAIGIPGDTVPLTVGGDASLQVLGAQARATSAGHRLIVAERAICVN
jgi:hypothetical protein